MGKIPLHRWPLCGDGGLEAEWRTDDVPPHRWNVGLSFLCPRHRVHRLAISFINPLDQDEEIPWLGAIRAWAYFDPDAEANIGTISFAHPHGGEELSAGMCGKLRVIDGWVELVVNGT